MAPASPNSAVVIDLAEHRALLRYRRLLTARRPASDTAAQASMADERREKILSDPRIHESIRTVIRLRGVPRTDVDDVLNDVIEDACNDPGLPLDDPEDARLYLSGCARHKSIDHARARLRSQRRFVSATEEPAGPQPLSIEQRVLAWKLFDLGRRLFPKTHDWFERFTLGDETHASIAADANVTAGHVRHEVSNIRRTLRTLAVAGVALFLLALGIRFATMQGARPAPHPAPSAPPSAPAPAVAQAKALRDRATHECDRGQWDRCANDLAKANELDPGGRSDELKAMWDRARDHLRTMDAEPKPPR
jgi:DNA-directed RNA polymerase specialized sigma24 family protein